MSGLPPARLHGARVREARVVSRSGDVLLPLEGSPGAICTGICMLTGSYGIVGAAGVFRSVAVGAQQRHVH